MRQEQQTGNINFKQLFNDHYRELCLFATHFTADTDQAEDLVQDCFVRLWEKVQQAEDAPVAAARPYLFAAVRNACLMALRAKHAEADGGDEAVRLMENDPQLAVSADTMDRSAREARLWTAIDALSKRRREVLLMVKRDGMSYAETAAELGISVKTVEHELAEAMKRLRGQRDDILFCLTFFLVSGNRGFPVMTHLVDV